MHFLVIGDIHADVFHLAEILIYSKVEKDIQGVILVGDLGADVIEKNHKEYLVQDRDRGQIYQESVNAVIKMVSRLNLPIYYVLGNHDLKEVQITQGDCHNIDLLNHGKHITLESGFSLLGIGGSNGKLGWPYDWDEEDVRKAALDYLRANKEIDLNRLILLTHDAPWFTRLDQSNTFSGSIPVGSEAIRELITKWNPRCLVCGHIHESSSVDLIGTRTIAVNAGIVAKPYISYQESPVLYQVTSVVNYAFSFYVLDLRDENVTIRHYHFDPGYQKVVKEEYSVENNRLCSNTVFGKMPIDVTGTTPYPPRKDIHGKLD
jgi:Icc-related predicted phosphoesterase